ncbi:MAG: hypothetical protein WCQ50_01145 [Spirochaetota bacterium]
MTEAVERDLSDILESIVAVAAPEKVILFGSQAEGTALPRGSRAQST